MEVAQDNILDFADETPQALPQISLGEEFALPQLQPSQNINLTDVTIDIETIQNAAKSHLACPTAENVILKIQNRRVRCPECNKYTCETEEKLLFHIRKVHRKENPFQCFMCDYSTYNKTLFEEHCRIHQGIKPFNCSKCPYRSASKKNTKKHELLHRPDNPRKCNLCEFVGRNNNSLLKHKLNEHGINLKCSGCSYSASTEAELAEHLLLHGSGYLMCKRCGLQCETKVQLRKHNSNGRKCSSCTLVLCSKKILRAHQVAAHGLEAVINMVKDAIFKCSICDWSSNMNTKILLHLIHHPNQCVDESVIDISVLKKHGIMV